MREFNEVFAGLAQSAFRQRFKLAAREREYLRAKGLPTILLHARNFVARRLAPAQPVNDGKQTPFRGHPVFVAQHATATCCRGCLARWHGIPAGRKLTLNERDHIVAAIERWISTQADAP